MDAKKVKRNIKKKVAAAKVKGKEAEKIAMKEFNKIKKQLNDTSKEVEGYIKKNPAKAALISAGIGAALGAVTGMLISNLIGTPKWMKPALETEYFIKTGLVLLGGELLFTKILAIGLPGLFVAWIVTPTVLILSFMFGQKVLKIPSKNN